MQAELRIGGGEGAYLIAWRTQAKSTQRRVRTGRQLPFSSPLRTGVERCAQVGGQGCRQAGLGAVRIAQAEDVAWEARGDDAFLSSHLILGAGPDNPYCSRTIANCLYRRGRMVEEWVVRDNLAPALQAGRDPDEVARTKFFRGYLGRMTEAPPADVMAAGDSGPRPDDYRSECEMVLDFIQQVWNDRNLDRVTQFMPRDLFLNDIGYRTWIRPEGNRRALLRMLRPFPSGQFQIRDVQTNYSVDYAGLRIAVCWVLVGDYDGQADFGPLTGRRTDILGISQFLVQNGKIVRETRVYDEIAVRAQINAARGDGLIRLTSLGSSSAAREGVWGRQASPGRHADDVITATGGR